MKINISIFFLFPILLIFFSNCTTDYFGFSESDEDMATSPHLNYKVAIAYCNKFNINGFSGILVAYYDWNQETFNKNKAQLYLQKVPYEFTYPPTNYIQIHSSYIANNQTVFKETPVSIKVVSNSTAEKSTLVTTIGHDLLKEMGDISIDKLIQTHHFVLTDMSGWHAITLSVFNVRNKPVKKAQAQVLIPPFEANPHTYLNTHNKEQLLFKLHPFANIDHASTNDQAFYEKGVDFCKESPIQFKIPPFKAQPITANPVDNIIDDLSLLPSF